jgi:chorismate synthase
MASNSFGTLFKITTWGESHGQAIGVVIDGCPAGLPISEDEINETLERRKPGKSAYTSPRKEDDTARIVSGVFEGVTTGAPISIIIDNGDADSSKYEPIKDLMRPGHANFTYLEKYGQFDYRGGGRASARETACRVAAGAVATKLLSGWGIKLVACISEIGDVKANVRNYGLGNLTTQTRNNVIFCPDEKAAKIMGKAIKAAVREGESLGGVVSFKAEGMPAGLGDPVYEKLEAKLANAMMSIPASKGFEIGEGFGSVTMLGSDHNDEFVTGDKGPLASNHAGGTLGGISTGEPVFGRVAFKPTSSILKPQKTIDVEGNEAEFMLPKGSRHDPCVAIRAVPVVEAMLALVLVDCYLMHRNSRV